MASRATGQYNRAMSEMTFTVLDAGRAIHARRHGSFVDVLLPALSDDPETIEELAHAMRRFLAPDDDQDPLAPWMPGDDDQAFDAGICLVDLAGRLIVYQSSYTEFLRCGQVTYEKVNEALGELARWIPYHISEEWHVTDQVDGWRAESRDRRQTRLAHPPLDTRKVLYDEVIEFLVDQCFAARGGATDREGRWTPPEGWQWRALPQRAAGSPSPRESSGPGETDVAAKPLFVSDALAEIHARWLMTPRPDLRGQTPREVLQARRDKLAFQLQDRELQWSTFGQCPQPLWRESAAYRFGGYGTHEAIVYYYLLRHLLARCWDMVVDPPAGQEPLARAAAIDRLGAAGQEWLHTPDQEEYSGKTPTQVIETERRRIPLGMSGAEAMIDDDCPLCQMMPDMGPMFWHLDGCNMDDDFPFDVFTSTSAEWEEKQREWADLDAKFEREAQARAAAREHGESPGADNESAAPSSSVWERSFSSPDADGSPYTSLFRIGAHLGELVVDLRGQNDAQRWIDTLNRDFGNLRDAAADPSGPLIAPVTETFCGHLADVSGVRPDLDAKCADLARRLDDFVRSRNDEPAGDEDSPF